MTYNVSSGTLNPSIPSSLHGLLHQSPHKHALVHLSLLFWHKQCPVLQWCPPSLQLHAAAATQSADMPS